MPISTSHIKYTVQLTCMRSVVGYGFANHSTLRKLGPLCSAGHLLQPLLLRAARGLQILYTSFVFNIFTQLHKTAKIVSININKSKKLVFIEIPWILTRLSFLAQKHHMLGMKAYWISNCLKFSKDCFWKIYLCYTQQFCSI